MGISDYKQTRLRLRLRFLLFALWKLEAYKSLKHRLQRNSIALPMIVPEERKYWFKRSLELYRDHSMNGFFVLVNQDVPQRHYEPGHGKCVPDKYI